MSAENPTPPDGSETPIDVPDGAGHELDKTGHEPDGRRISETSSILPSGIYDDFRNEWTDIFTFGLNADRLMQMKLPPFKRKRLYEEYLAEIAIRFADEELVDKVLQNPHTNRENIQKINEITNQYNEFVDSLENKEGEYTKEDIEKAIDFHNQIMAIISSR